MNPIDRITALAQSIYLARNSQKNDVTGADLDQFVDNTIEWVNQLIPEIEKKTDWNFVRTNNDLVGSVYDTTAISYELPEGIRKLVVSPYRDLTIVQDGTVVSSFKLVDPNQLSDPTDYDTRDRATSIKRQVIFSRTMNDTEVNGEIIADTIGFIPKLSLDDMRLMDIFDEYPDIRQLFVLGVVKNQILPDIVKGGLYPSYAQKFDTYLQDCIAENDASADASDAARESFGWVSGVGF